jgi:signal recognition particle receptor subunit beta
VADVARIDRDRRTIALTLLVVGARGAGKTTVLRTLRQRIPTDRLRAGSSGESDPDPMLDWLTMDLGRIQGWQVQVDLYAVGPVSNRDSTRRLLFNEADGLWLLADSQANRFDDNAATFRAAREQLVDREGRQRDLPTVYTWSKQDLPGELILAPDVLRDGFAPGGAPAFEADLVRGTGVLESLHALVTLTMRRLAPAREQPS